MKERFFNQPQSIKIAQQFFSHLSSGFPDIALYWKETFEIASGREYRDSILLAPAGIFTLMIELCGLLTYKYILPFHDTLILLFRIRYQSDQFPIENNLWSQILDKTNPSHKEQAEPYVINDIKLFDMNESACVTVTFIDYLYFRNYLSEETLSDLGSFIDESFGYEDSWEEVYNLIYGDEYNANHLLTSAEIYTAMIQICGINIYKHQFNWDELLILLMNIRYREDKFIEEKKYWMELINEWVI